MVTLPARDEDMFIHPMQRRLDDVCAASGGGCQPVHSVSEARRHATKITNGTSKFRVELELSPDVKIPCSLSTWQRRVILRSVWRTGLGVTKCGHSAYISLVVVDDWRACAHR